MNALLLIIIYRNSEPIFKSWEWWLKLFQKVWYKLNQIT